MGKLDNRVAIVTGAASGMGEAIARLFAAEGAKVLAVGRSTNKIHDVLGGVSNIETMARSVGEEGAAQAIIEQAATSFEGLDILVNNAGAGGAGPTEHITDEDWRANFDLNIDAMFRLCREAIPHLRNSAAGRIINIGSAMSMMGGPGMGAYAASKHAVVGLSRTLACELGADDITVNTLIPGAIHTQMTQGIFDNDQDMVDHWAQKAPLGRWGTPDDIAPPALFLASDDAGFITGTNLVVDGGAAVSP